MLSVKDSSKNKNSNNKKSKLPELGNKVKNKTGTESSSNKHKHKKSSKGHGVDLDKRIEETPDEDEGDHTYEEEGTPQQSQDHNVQRIKAVKNNTDLHAMLKETMKQVKADNNNGTITENDEEDSEEYEDSEDSN